MKNFKKFFLLICSLIVLISGVVLFIVFRNEGMQSGKFFLAISLLIVGVVGSLASFFIFIFNKKMETFGEDDEKFRNLASTIKYKLEEIKEEKQTTQQQNEQSQQKEVENKNKKIKCTYCKCKYSSLLDRCPNCGAPPELEN